MNADYVAAATRALGRSVTDPITGCIRFTGRRDKGGYGLAHVRGLGGRGAHRVVYIAATGRAIPAGLELDHLCHSRSDCRGDANCPHRLCVNPEHLEPVTPLENGRRQWSARKDRCDSGHEYTPENTYIRAGKGAGRRDCRACIRDRVARYKAKKSAA